MGAVFSQNIVATTADGKKVVLKSDKTWEYVVDVPKPQAVVQPNNKFAIDDLKAVEEFTFINGKEIEKSEFETEDQYQQRLAKFAEEKQFNGKSIKEIAFAVDPLYFGYSAETQSFKVTIYGSLSPEFVKRSDSYFSQNIIDFSFKMSPQKAQELKTLMQIVVLGFPVKKSNYQLQVVATQIIVRNQNTGEIYYNAKQSSVLDKYKTSEIKNLPLDSTTSETPKEAAPTYNTPSSTYSAPKTVQVKGYTRKDGTYVAPHTRSAPQKH